MPEATRNNVKIVEEEQNTAEFMDTSPIDIVVDTHREPFVQRVKQEDESPAERFTVPAR